MESCRYTVMHLACKQIENVQVYVSGENPETPDDDKKIKKFAHWCHTNETEDGEICQIALNEKNSKYEIIERRW